MTADRSDEPASSPAAALAGLRVLDLTDVAGALGPRLLADLGADVVRVETPAGSRLRRMGPFPAGVADAEASAAAWLYTSSERGVALDPASTADRDELARLVARADVLIEADPPDLLGAFAIDRGRLAREGTGLVHVAISAFGRGGPRAGWLGSDLVCASAAGMTYVNGAPDAPPLAPFGLQAYHATGVFAAIAALLALRRRRRTGRGATVDLSVQAATAAAVEHVTGFYRQTGAIEARRGTLHWSRSFRIAPCREGALLLCLLGDWTTLVEWVASADPDAAAPLRDPRLEDVDARKAECEAVFDALDRWAAAQDAREVAETAQLLRLPFARVRAPHELASDEQLAGRGFPIALPASGTRPAAIFPGAPFHLSATPWALRREPPRLGEHTAEVRLDPAWGPPTSALATATAAASVRAAGTSRAGTSDVGASNGAVASSPPVAAPGASAPAPPGDPRPLAGITVLDFTWVVAGPVATRILADHGARVLKVERSNAADFGDRRGGLSGNLNRGKESIVIDLALPAGRDLARRLAARSDVVIDNFSARVMRNLGLDWPSLRALHPAIVAVGMSGFGHTGPWRDHVSYGPTLQALAGFPVAMRHPGGPLAGWGYSWSDMAAGMMAALATLAALEHRDRTGCGQWVDLGQYESLVALLGPTVFDALAGRDVAPVGNASQEGSAMPHGVFRCAADRRLDGNVDDDRWVAIAVLDDAQWAGLAAVLAHDGEAWARDAALASLAGREARARSLHAALEAWTRRHGAEEVAERLQAARVPASVVASGEDLCRRDPQLAARGFFRAVRSPEGAEVVVDGLPFAGDAVGSDVLAPGPLLGEHSEVILREVLAMEPAEIASLREQGVIA